MSGKNPIRKVYDFYRDGFRNMDTGRVLWAVVLVKLFIIFAVLKLFFFPNILHEKAERGGEAEYVSSQLIDAAK
ncbi:MAG: DUF4492 domain-containing protein [Prevotella sp.]|nr:DUF4492 domain-containing protein [Prevotella sp.]